MNYTEQELEISNNGSFGIQSNGHAAKMRIAAETKGEIPIAILSPSFIKL